MPVDPAARGLPPRNNPKGTDFVFVSPSDYSQPGWVPSDGLHYQDTPVSETFVGTPRVYPFYTLARKKTYSFNGTLYSYDGVTIESLVYSDGSDPTNGGVTSFTLNNVVNVNGNFDYQNVAGIVHANIGAPSLKSIGGNFICTYSDPVIWSFPVLEVIGGNFAPTGWDQATAGINFPALKIVGGNFNPNNCAGVQSWTFSALTTVVNDFNVNALYCTALSFPVLTKVGNNLTIQVCNNPSLSFTFPQLATVGGQVLIFNNSSITTIPTTSFPALVSTNYVSVKSNAAMTTVNFPALTTITGGSLYFENMAALTTINCPNLSYVFSGVSLKTCNAIVSLSLPALTVSNSGFSLESCNSFTTLSVPNLARIGGQLLFKSCPALVSVTFSGLTQMGVKIAYGSTSYGQGFICAQTCNALTTMNFPVLHTLAGIQLITSTAALTTFTFGVPWVRCDNNIQITSAALNQTTVDLILARAAALDGTNGTIAFSSPRYVQIQGTSAAPSAAGLASKAILVARGVTVTHN